MAVCFIIQPELLPIKVLYSGNMDFDENMDPYFLEIYTGCANFMNFLRRKLSFDRQTGGHKLQTLDLKVKNCCNAFSGLVKVIIDDDS